LIRRDPYLPSHENSKNNCDNFYTQNVHRTLIMYTFEKTGETKKNVYETIFVSFIFTIKIMTHEKNSIVIYPVIGTIDPIRIFIDKKSKKN